MNSIIWKVVVGVLLVMFLYTIVASIFVPMVTMNNANNICTNNGEELRRLGTIDNAALQTALEELGMKDITITYPPINEWGTRYNFVVTANYDIKIVTLGGSMSINHSVLTTNFKYDREYVSGRLSN